MFLIDRLIDTGDHKSIELTQVEIENLAKRWFDQMGREPLPEELAGLIEERAQQEMLVREATSLGLDRDDIIIQRHLMQKLRFLVEDAAIAEPVSSEVLQNYFTENQSRYEQPATYAFSHVFFKDKDIKESPHVEKLLDQLNHGNDGEQLGEPFLMGSEFKDMTLSRLVDSFGESFAKSVSDLPADGRWHGALESQYGLHVVRMDEVKPSKPGDFNLLTDQLRNDLDLERRDKAFETYVEQLQQEYTVVIP